MTTAFKLAAILVGVYVLCAWCSAARAEVRVTCIVEPNERLKDVEQLGCDFKNTEGIAVTLSAGDVRDGSLEKIGSPLRYSVASHMIDRSERRGFWGTFFLVAKWTGVALSFAQGLDFIKFDQGDNWRYLIPTVTGALQTVDSVGSAGHTPLTMPPDYLPEGDFTLGPYETRSHVLLAGRTGLVSFRMSLIGRALTTAVRQPAPARFEFEAKHPLEFLHRLPPDRQVWAYIDGSEEDAITEHNMQHLQMNQLVVSEVVLAGLR